jgi:imidazolonepropionase-like amidohydrolase
MSTERIVFSNVRIFDGSGSAPVAGEVLVEGRHIAGVAHTGDGASGRVPRAGARVIDGGGGTLLPGLIEPHAHLAFGATVDRRLVWRTLPKETQQLVAVEAGRVMLDFGYTSAYSGGAADPRWEVALRTEFGAGWLPGPRLRACSFERQASSVTGVAGAYAGIGQRPPDVAGVRQFVREMADLGVDAVKFVMTGESAIRPGTSRVMQFYEEEIAAGADEARKANIWLNGHCHSAESVKLAVKHGFRGLYHCTWSDEEAIEALVAAREQLFVVPGAGVYWAAFNQPGRDCGISAEMAEAQEQPETFARVAALVPKLVRRGVRVLPGGDYGLPFNPIGRNAHDIELFTTHFGVTAAQALQGATQYGGQIMGMGEELGLVREGYLADLLLVDGDPLQEITLLQDRARFRVIMQDGRLHKAPQPH